MAFKNIQTILLVENEPLIALDLESMLLSAGARRIHHVVSSREALLWLETNDADLTILDIVVSDGSSAAVAERLNQRGTPFVIHSGHLQNDASRAAPFGGAVWLPKPCTQADLVLAIERSLGLSL